MLETELVLLDFETSVLFDWMQVVVLQNFASDEMTIDNH